MSNRHNRVFGLDVVRAIAVLLVLIGHASYHGHAATWFKWFWGAQGTLGVEIFFVLSGFLIGGILLRLARTDRLHRTGDVWNFWVRRWARTLPLYVFFFLLYLRFDYLGVGDLLKTYPFLVFMQNFAWAPLPFFQHSWSLAVEEWFYLLFPLVFLAAASSGLRFGRAFGLTCAVFIVGPLAMRVRASAGIADYDGFNNLIRMVVVCRLDAIAMGVLVAWIQVDWKPVYEGLQRWGWIAAMTVLASAFYLAAGMPSLIGHPSARVLFFPIMSLAIAAAIPWVAGIRTLGWHALDGFVSLTSKISYSLYLGHICMLTLVNGALAEFGMGADSGVRIPTPVLYGLYMAAFYVFAMLTYAFVERPFLMLRDIETSRASISDGAAQSTSRN